MGGGYGCRDLSFRGLLVALLHDVCAIPESAAGKLVDQLAEVGARFGLDVSGYSTGVQTKVHRLGGQMLQIFIPKEDINRLVYHSRPYGIPMEGSRAGFTLALRKVLA